MVSADAADAVAAAEDLPLSISSRVGGPVFALLVSSALVTSVVMVSFAAMVSSSCCLDSMMALDTKPRLCFERSG